MSDLQQNTYKQFIAIAEEALPDGPSGVCDPLAAKTAAAKIEALGVPALDAVSLAIQGPDLRVKAFLMHMGEPGLKYLAPALASPDERTAYNAIGILSEIGEPAWDIIVSTFRNDQRFQIQDSAAFGLIKLGERGLQVLARVLEGDNERLQQIAASALARFLMNEHGPGRGHERSSDGRIAPVINLLSKALEHNSFAVRRSAINGLRIADELSFDAIKRLLEDLDEGVRTEALTALCSRGIDQTTAPFLARAFEDASGALSTNAIAVLSRSKQIRIDPEAVMAAIIDVLIARRTGLPEENFNSDIAVQALKQTITLNPQLHGQILRQLRDIAYEYPKRVHRRAVFVAKKLDAEEFTELVNERAQQNPEAAKAINRLIGVGTDTAALVKQLSEADPGDVQTIAASQIGLLQSYYQDALAQSKVSFRWAWISQGTGFILLTLTLIFLLITQSQSITTILTAVGTVVTQFIAALQFVLYREARKQVADYHQQLVQTQRFLLANSVCQSLEGEAKQKARAELVRAIAAIDQKQEATSQSTS